MRRLAVAFVALNVVDIMVTLWLVSSGRGVEANPVMGAVIGASPALSILFKVGVSVAVATMIIKWNKPQVMGALVAVMSGVCLFNIGGVYA